MTAGSPRRPPARRSGPGPKPGKNWSSRAWAVSLPKQRSGFPARGQLSAQPYGVLLGVGQPTLCRLGTAGCPVKRAYPQRLALLRSPGEHRLLMRSGRLVGQVHDSPPLLICSLLERTAHAATSVLRGRPRGRLRGTTSPRRNSWPPQTPHGSRRSKAPARQARRAGQSRHSSLADSTSWGDSAKNSSGSSLHGSPRPFGSPAVATGPVRTAGPVLVFDPACAVCASYPAEPSKVAVVPGRNIGIPSHLLVVRSPTPLTKRCPRLCMTKAADPVSGSAAFGGSGRSLLDRFPRRMRARNTAASRGDAGLLCVVVLDGVLLGRDMPPEHLLRRETPPAQDVRRPGSTRARENGLCAARHGPDAGKRDNAHAGTEPHVSVSRDIKIHVQHPGHPPFSSVNGPVVMGAAYVAIPAPGNPFSSRFCGRRGRTRHGARTVPQMPRIAPPPGVSWPDRAFLRSARPACLPGSLRPEDWARIRTGPGSGLGPDQPFLYHRDDELAVAGEHLPAGQPQCAAGNRGLLRGQQPPVGTEWPVEPHRVIQAGAGGPTVRPGQPMRQQNRIQQGHVGGIGHQADMQQRIVG